MVLEERKKLVKKIIEGIPTKTDELFSYAIDWTPVTKQFVDAKVEPWVKKKITQLIGEEEKSLIEFICGKISEHADARLAILSV